MRREKPRGVRVCRSGRLGGARVRTQRILARAVLGYADMSQHKDPMQGEGDRASARRYDSNVRQFVGEGKVDDAAHEAEQYVERDPEGAAEAEAAAKRGPSRRVSVDEIIAKGHSLVDRVRPIVGRAVDSVKARLGRK